MLPPTSLYCEAAELLALPLVPAVAPAPAPAVELDGDVLDGLAAVLDDAPGVRAPAPMFALARMKLSALDAAPPAALPLVPVADGALDDCRQPVTVTLWLDLLLDDGVCGELLPVCAATPTLIAAARIDPNTTLRFIA